MKLTNIPIPPTARTILGFSTSGALINRFRAAMDMEKQMAMRKTQLIKAPTIWARTQPYVFVPELCFDICNGIEME